MKRFLALTVLAALLAAPAAVLAHEEQFTADLAPEAGADVPDGYAGTGMAMATISDDHSQITFEVTFEGLTGPLTMAHIHWLPSGATSGPPILWLTDQSNMEGTPSPLTGTLTEADLVPADGGPQTFEEALDAIRAGDTYVNLHTERNPAGEIRGRLTAVPPDTATVDEAIPASSLPWTIVLVALGLAILVPVARRFASRLA